MTKTSEIIMANFDWHTKTGWKTKVKIPVLVIRCAIAPYQFPGKREESLIDYWEPTTHLLFRCRPGGFVLCLN